MAEKKPNWKAAKAEYLKGGSSLADIAKKYGIPLGTMKTRSSKEKWADAKSETATKVMSDLPSVVAAVVINEAAEMTRAQIDDLKEAGRIARSFLLSGVSDVQALKDWATAYKMIQACQRIALGLEGKGGDGANGTQPAISPDPIRDDLDPADAVRLYREETKASSPVQD